MVLILSRPETYQMVELLAENPFGKFLRLQRKGKCEGNRRITEKSGNVVFLIRMHIGEA